MKIKFISTRVSKKQYAKDMAKVDKQIFQAMGMIVKYRSEVIQLAKDLKEAKTNANKEVKSLKNEMRDLRKKVKAK